MKLVIKIIIAGLCLVSCKSKSIQSTNHDVLKDDLVIAFGSCNKQFETNVLWAEVLKNKPNVWIWGGDNIYSDTDDMVKMKDDYSQLLQQKEYEFLTKSTKILATWDDHDYGLNDGGEEFMAKKESQQLFLDFLGVSKSDERRKQAGIYTSEVIQSEKGSVKIIVLDTRYFRTSLTNAEDSSKRFKPNSYGEGTMLGETQWKWLENELKNSSADFNIIVSSIQFLSGEHGFETWANFPHESEKLMNLIVESKSSSVLILSGDRHISEFSKTVVDGLRYPLIDFTSSGLTHTYSNFTSEPNKFRVGDVISKISFGLLRINFESKTITMEMRGKENELQQKLLQKY